MHGPPTMSLGSITPLFPTPVVLCRHFRGPEAPSAGWGKVQPTSAAARLGSAKSLSLSWPFSQPQRSPKKKVRGYDLD